MITFKVLPKMLYKPKEAYESLGDVNAKEGIAMWFILTLISLMLFVGAIRNLGIKGFSPIPFGFGTSITLSTVLFGFAKGFFVLILMSYLATLISGKIGGTGTFSGTLGMIGYSYILSLVKTISSIILLVYFVWRINYISKITTAGGTMSGVEMWGLFPFMVMILNVLFVIWFHWITSTAVSVSQHVSFLRGLVAVIISFFVVNSMFIVIKFLTGYELSLF